MEILELITFKTVTNKAKFSDDLWQTTNKSTGIMKWTNDFRLKRKFIEIGQIECSIFTMKGTKFKLHWNKWFYYKILVGTSVIERRWHDNTHVMHSKYASWWSFCFDANIIDTTYYRNSDCQRQPDDELNKWSQQKYIVKAANWKNRIKDTERERASKKHRIQFAMVHLVTTFDNLNNAKRNECSLWRSSDNNCASSAWYVPGDATESMRPTEWQTHTHILNHDPI